MPTPRLCRCGGPIKGPARKRFCSSACRLRAHRAEVRAGKVPIPTRRPPEPDVGARVQTIPIERAARFAYADPAYPGKAHLYPENEEIDHEILIGALCDEFPDGWALSTASDTLREVLLLCPAGVRVASWHRQHRPYNERPRAWEPVIVCGGRRQPDQVVPDALVCHVPPGWDLPGRKPPGFYRWVWGLLGMERRDEFIELYPGSGTGLETLAAWRG